MTPKDLKQLRAKLGLSQQALAGKLGVSRNTVNRWEMGTRAISPMAERLIRTLL